MAAFGKKFGLGMALPPPIESGPPKSPGKPEGCNSPLAGRGDADTARPGPTAGPGPMPIAGDAVAARASPGPKAGDPILIMPPALTLGEAVVDLDKPDPCAMPAATSYGEGSIGVPIRCGALGDPTRLPGWFCMSNPAGLFAGMFIWGSRVKDIITGPMDVARSRSKRA